MATDQHTLTQYLPEQSTDGSPDHRPVSDFICDECRSVSWRIGLIGDKQVCRECWDRRYELAQQQLWAFADSEYMPPHKPVQDRRRTLDPPIEISDS